MALPKLASCLFLVLTICTLRVCALNFNRLNYDEFQTGAGNRLNIDIMDYDDEDYDNNNDGNENRVLIGATGNVPFNASQLATIVGLLAAALLPLLGLICLCSLAVLALIHKDSGGYGDGGGYGDSAGYNSYASAYRALGIEDIDWEKMSIIDWVEMGQEVFRKFDPSNLECHKKAICELHRSAEEFGTLATTFVNIFGYLRYLELLSVPQLVKDIISEYQDAADRGRSLTKDCSDMFPDCEFSIKAMYDRYHDNSVR